MTVRKLFVVEKQDVVKRLIHLLNENDLIILAPSINGYKFNYQKLNFLNAPYTKEKPKYKMNLNANYIDHFLTYCVNKDGKTKITFLEKHRRNIQNNKQTEQSLINEFLCQFDEIVCACDRDHTGIRSFDFKFSKYFNLGDNYIDYFISKNIKTTQMIMLDLLKTSITNSFKSRKNISDSRLFLKLKEDYLKKDFFDYNYNLNSLLFFSQFNNSKMVITRNMIQTLYILKSCDNIDSVTLLSKMNRKQIGSIASRSEIIEKLIELNFFEKTLLKFCIIDDKRESLRQYFKLSKKGKELINQCHKKINDPFLSERLLNDIFGHKNGDGLPINDFYKKYEQYLYTAFSKQKRFLNKQKKSSQ